MAREVEPASTSNPDHVVTWLLLEITDTGIGIAASAARQLFEPFQQADTSITRRFGGTGLGLPICLKLIRRMGGTLWLTSKEGVGSSFLIALPVFVTKKSANSMRKATSAIAAALAMARADISHGPPEKQDRVTRSLAIGGVKRTNKPGVWS